MRIFVSGDGYFAPVRHSSGTYPIVPRLMLVFFVVIVDPTGRIYANASFSSAFLACSLLRCP